MIETPARSKASSSTNLPNSTIKEANAPTAPASALPDLLAGLRWGGRELAVAGIALIAIDLFAGWAYLASYFSYFRIPSAGLDLTVQEILAQGLRTVLLPLTVVVFAFLAPGRKLRQAAMAVGVYLVMLAVVAFANEWASGGAIAVQLAAAVASAAIVFGLRVGVGRKPTERMTIAAAVLLLLLSIPVASGTLDAGQAAATKATTLRLVTNAPVLPSAVPAAGQYQYTNYVLLRENSNRYWVFRIGDHYAYSISKSEVVSIRY